jgi:hypothetical protein
MVPPAANACFYVLYGFGLDVERAKLGIGKTQGVEN